MVIVWRSAERHAPQCSARAAASEYCWLELRATQRCSSPAEKVSVRASAISFTRIQSAEWYKTYRQCILTEHKMCFIM